MGSRLHLGRVRHVDVGVEWSWILTFVFSAWTLFGAAVARLPYAPSGALSILSIGLAVGLVGSLVAHELVHALSARACGAPVRRVTFLLFGATTDLEARPASPKTEIVASALAALANAIAGGLLLAVASFVRDDAAAPDASMSLRVVSAFLSWLGVANVAIAAWNLLPAYPLAGGRLLRAVLWRVTGNVLRATRWAAWMGEIVGVSLIVLGVALAFAGPPRMTLWAVWGAVLGWFVASAAARGYEAVERERGRADAPEGARPSP